VQFHGSLESLARAFERPDLTAEPRFSAARPSRQDQALLVDTLDGIFGRYDFADVKRRLDAVGARYEPVQRMIDVVEDPQAVVTGRFVDVVGQQGPSRQVANPWSVFEDGEPVRRPMGHVPTLGEHTVEILKALGYGEADISRMRENGTILPNA
jgi:succinate--hydroxymethylglutarate CoA-transferase